MALGRRTPGLSAARERQELSNGRDVDENGVPRLGPGEGT